VNLINVYGDTALIMAVKKGHTEIVSILKAKNKPKSNPNPNPTFILDTINKEITYNDAIEGEITINIKTYLQQDKDNIIIIYKSNKKDIDLEYFGTTRTIITDAYNYPSNIFYGCNKVAKITRVPKNNEYNEKNTYFKLNRIGLTNTFSEYCDIQTLFANKKHQLFAIKSLNIKYPSFIKHKIS